MQHRICICSGKIHFIDKQKCGNLIPLQQPPKRFCVALYPICSTDDQNGIIQHLQRAFHFCGKVYMSRRVQQRQFQVLHSENSLLGKNCNATVALQGVRIQKRISMIHTSQTANGSRPIQHRLGKRGLPGVYMCQNPYNESFQLPHIPSFFTYLMCFIIA